MLEPRIRVNANYFHRHEAMTFELTRELRQGAIKSNQAFLQIQLIQATIFAHTINWVLHELKSLLEKIA